ncbi:unnamed protein product [Sympodiomycopsis kandeliae]
MYDTHAYRYDPHQGRDFAGPSQWMRPNQQQDHHYHSPHHHSSANYLPHLAGHLPRPPQYQPQPFLPQTEAIDGRPAPPYRSQSDMIGSNDTHPRTRNGEVDHNRRSAPRHSAHDSNVGHAYSHHLNSHHDPDLTDVSHHQHHPPSLHMNRNEHFSGHEDTSHACQPDAGQHLRRHPMDRHHTYPYGARPMHSNGTRSDSPADEHSIDATNESSHSAPLKGLGAAKPVVRAACLSCRTAKRRCDGAQPVCGPCVSRGVTVDSGACVFVASKRGGPRFKGCTGEEAKRIKAEKEAKKLERARNLSNGSSSTVYRPDSHQHPRNPALASDNSQMQQSQYHYRPAITSRSSSATTSSGGGFQEEMAEHNGSMFVSPRHRPAQQQEALSDTSRTGSSSIFTDEIARSRESYNTATSQSLYPMASPAASLQASATPLKQSQGTSQRRQHDSHISSASLPSEPNAQKRSPTPADIFASLASQGIVEVCERRDRGAGGQTVSNTHETGQPALSSANLELWQRIQEKTARPLDSATDGHGGAKNGFGDFWARLERLPKAGNVGSNDVGMKLLSFDSEDDGVQLDSADSEQQARFLLTAFFEKVYASAPVLLAPENLSSLAFWFSGKGPCALYAAISALVTLRLPENEAYKTLRGGYQHGSAGGPAKMTKSDIAAHHARTSQFLLRRFSLQQASAAAASFGLDPASVSAGCDTNDSGRSLCQGPADPELLRIEAAAAHTLLCHYFYSSGGHTAQAVAHEHAMEAWGSMQSIRIELQEAVEPATPLTTSHFSWEQKQEWAKRVYWTSFAAAIVTACTGGFRPVRYTYDAVAALKLRPALESDVGAWGVFIRGAQHVGRGYAALYDLQALREDNDLSEEAKRQGRAEIYASMMKLDRDMATFSAYDPAWRSQPETSYRSGQAALGLALRIAGKLMTAGTTVIIHRGQAFANAHIFMHPQCGLPRATRDEVSKIIHRRDREVSQRGAIRSDEEGEDSIMTDGDQNLHRSGNFGGGWRDSSHSLVDVDESGRPETNSGCVAPIPAHQWHQSGANGLSPASSAWRGQHLDSSFALQGASGHRSHGASTTGEDRSGQAMHADPAASMAATALQQFHLDGNGHGTNSIASRSDKDSNDVRYVRQNNGSLPQNGSPATSTGRRVGSVSGSADSAHQLGSQAAVSGLHDAVQHIGQGQGGQQDPYAHGPFEPEHSLSKCSWAAEAMLDLAHTLLRPWQDEDGTTVYALGNTGHEAPSLPPWAACTFVLGGYCVLMQCLVVQAARAWYRNQAKNEVGDGDNHAIICEQEAELKKHHGQVEVIFSILERFALTHNIANDYQAEVRMLLEINRGLE